MFRNPADRLPRYGEAIPAACLDPHGRPSLQRTLRYFLPSLSDDRIDVIAPKIGSNRLEQLEAALREHAPDLFNHDA